MNTKELRKVVSVMKANKSRNDYLNMVRIVGSEKRITFQMYKENIDQVQVMVNTKDGEVFDVTLPVKALDAAGNTFSTTVDFRAGTDEGEGKA